MKVFDIMTDNGKYKGRFNALYTMLYDVILLIPNHMASKFYQTKVLMGHKVVEEHYSFFLASFESNYPHGL